MKRDELIRRLRQAGYVLARHGGSPDWYSNPSAGESQPLPRNNEIKEPLAKHILKKLSAV